MQRIKLWHGILLNVLVFQRSCALRWREPMARRPQETKI